MLYKAKAWINDKYSVVFPIKKGAYSETYRVKDADGRRYFFKLMDTSLIQPWQLDAQGNIREIKILEELNHPNLPQFVDKGELTVNGHRYMYMVNDFLSSETVSDRLLRSGTMRVYDAKQIIMGVLDAVKYLHSRPNPIIHNEITALNTLIDLTTTDLRKVRLIDFGYARYLDEAYGQSIDGLNWFYLAPECFDGSTTQQSDLYSVGAMLYQLVFGMLPWFCDMSNIEPDRRRQYVVRQKETQLLMPYTLKLDADDNLLNIMRKALAADPDDRFQSADEFLEAIENNATVEAPEQRPATADDRADAFSAHSGKNRGNGFADVAGMQSLKDMLTNSVLFALKNREKSKKYKLQIPNGILLYGPPGCGKSFIAEKFAEEAGYNFRLVKASDLASVYVHGSQEKIGALFDEARKTAPTILCFDEFDALVPARGKTGTEHQAGEVNEFLTQLNNCGEHDVFVIASTNRPDVIDSAVLRRGRIDKVIYIPVPDAETRAAMFEIHLKGRPCDSDINYEHLASLTNNYIASDIAYIVNEAATRAAFSDEKISEAGIEKVISESSPSLTPSMMNEYSKMREKMEGIVEQRRRIGF